MADNHLYYGDNLEVLAKLPSESVDLVYLDPPFNSARNYNVIFSRSGEATPGASAQIQAFEDTWTWDQETEHAAEIHNRMPLVIPEDFYDAWLDPERAGDGELRTAALEASETIAQQLVYEPA